MTCQLVYYKKPATNIINELHLILGPRVYYTKKDTNLCEESENGPNRLAMYYLADAMLRILNLTPGSPEVFDFTEFGVAPKLRDRTGPRCTANSCHEIPGVKRN